MIFERILVPTDLSERNQHSLDIAARMALQDGSEITLLHVIETLADTPYEELESFYNNLEKKANRSMDEMIGRYRDKPVTIRKAVKYGRRTQEILLFAEANRIDLIVMNSHRIDPDSPTQGWGTISHKVGILSGCPVLLVK